MIFGATRVKTNATGHIENRARLTIGEGPGGRGRPAKSIATGRFQHRYRLQHLPRARARARQRPNATADRPDRTGPEAGVRSRVVGRGQGTHHQVGT